MPYLKDENGFVYVSTPALEALGYTPCDVSGGPLTAASVPAAPATPKEPEPNKDPLSGLEGKPLEDLTMDQLKALAVEWKVKHHPNIGQKKLIEALTAAMGVEA